MNKAKQHEIISRIREMVELDALQEQDEPMIQDGSLHPFRTQRFRNSSFILICHWIVWSRQSFPSFFLSYSPFSIVHSFHRSTCLDIWNDTQYTLLQTCSHDPEKCRHLILVFFSSCCFDFIFVFFIYDEVFIHMPNGWMQPSSCVSTVQTPIQQVLLGEPLEVCLNVVYYEMFGIVEGCFDICNGTIHIENGHWENSWKDEHNRTAYCKKATWRYRTINEKTQFRIKNASHIRSVEWEM